VDPLERDDFLERSHSRWSESSSTGSSPAIAAGSREPQPGGRARADAEKVGCVGVLVLGVPPGPEPPAGPFAGGNGAVQSAGVRQGRAAPSLAEADARLGAASDARAALLAGSAKPFARAIRFPSSFLLIAFGSEGRDLISPGLSTRTSKIYSDLLKPPVILDRVGSREREVRTGWHVNGVSAGDMAVGLAAQWVPSAWALNSRGTLTMPRFRGERGRQSPGLAGREQGAW